MPAATPPVKGEERAVLDEALAFAAANGRIIERCEVCRLPFPILAGVHAMRDQAKAEIPTISAWVKTKGHPLKDHHFRKRAAGQGHGAKRH
jgi:hypothetical protein